jgi:hypothetical protein
MMRVIFVEENIVKTKEERRKNDVNNEGQNVWMRRQLILRICGNILQGPTKNMPSTKTMTIDYSLVQIVEFEQPKAQFKL